MLEIYYTMQIGKKTDFENRVAYSVVFLGASYYYLLYFDLSSLEGLTYTLLKYIRYICI